MGNTRFREAGLIWVILFIATFLTVAESGAAPLPGGTLDPLTIPKYADPLPILGVMEPLSTAGGIDYYEIAVRQFEQQVLSTGTGLPMTKVWSYGTVNPAGTFFYPAFTIEATVERPVKVKWMNQLVNDPVGCAEVPGSSACNYLSHLLPVDRTLHWANPEQLMCMGSMVNETDCRPDPSNGDILQQSYDGPVPMVTHLHGAHVNPDSDGYPEAWWLPAANNIPPGYATRGSNYGQIPGAPLEAGAALYQYRNDQRAATLWFHDHSLGMTRVNVYAGPAGFYLLRGGPDDMASEPVPFGLPGPAPKIGDAPGTNYHEIPIVIQDRSFNADGSLFYATSRAFFDGYGGPYVGDANTVSDISPIWNPEFFGNTMVVNGKTWPYLNVEPRKYRIRFLNGCDSRFLILKFDKKLTFTQIGTEGGFLPQPVVLNQLLMGLAERADVVVDFSAFAPGSVITLLNVGPDEPFGGLPVPKNIAADPATTGQVMQFKVVLPLAAPDKSAVKKLPAITPISTNGATTRKVSLNELESNFVCVDKNMIYTTPLATNPLTCLKFSVPLAPLEAQLGTVDPLTGLGVPHPWMDAITEDPALNSTEIWEIHNFTVDAHPIHVHQVMFQVVDRTPMGAIIGGAKTRPPEVWETGFKDTVIAYPGEITRIKAVFDIAGLFVWHCHILSHEDNEMMRPMCVGGGCNP
ncbi:MAG TPA: multicopper oxidase [Nitrospirota bacterium]|nr:multicopper oxidase [Nitrospirota bacterium]